MPTNCHGLGCTSTDLINAHFIPQAFPRKIQTRSRVRNTTVSELRFTRRMPHGISDNEILCGACDQYLGREYDKPACELINALGSMEFVRSKFEIPNVNCDLLSAFILAVLWRCSVSKMFEVSNINLLGFTNSARMVLWHAMPLSALRAYRVLCQRYYPLSGVDQFFSLRQPVTFEFEDGQWHGYVVPLVGFRFMVIIDPRRLPPQYEPYILNGSTVLRGSFVDFPNTYEADQARIVLAFHDKAS
jgi:hypothetical protein